MSERHACRLFQMSRTGYRYQTKGKGDEEILTLFQELAENHPRWGFGKMFNWLRNQGHHWNHKRVRRIYREVGLNLQVKPQKRLPKRQPQPLIVPTKAKG